MRRRAFGVRCVPLTPRACLPLILLITIGFGLAGLDWGLPYTWHADEKVNQAASMIDRHTADPGFFVNPSLHLYMVWGLTHVAYAVYPGAFVPSAVGWHIQSSRSGAPNRAITFLAYRLARLLSVFFATLTVWLLWVRGRVAFDSATGLVAAGFLAVTMGLANVAHFATPETTLCLLVLAALGRFEAVAIAPTPRNYAIAGALIGLACSTKYTVWLLGVPFLAAHVAAQRTASGAARAFGLLLLAAAVAAAAFVITTPYSVLSARRFVEDLWFNWTTGAPSGTLSGQRRSWGAYILTLGNALGWPLFAAALVGAMVTVSRAREAAERARAAALVHGIWILSFWGFYGISPHHALRFILPIVPSLLLLGAAGLVALSRKSPRHRRAVLIVLTLVLMYSAAYTAEADRKLVRDPRYAAGAWLKQHVRAGSTVGFFTNESYLPYFDRPAFSVRYLEVMAQYPSAGDEFRARIDRILNDGPDIIVDANFYFDRFLYAPERFPERAEFYRRLLAGAGAGTFRPVARFSVHGPPWLDPKPELVAPDVFVFARAATRWQ